VAVYILPSSQVREGQVVGRYAYDRSISLV
jgi:hypothetical protein